LKPTAANARRLVESLGGVLRIDEGWDEYDERTASAEAPAGHVWPWCGVHELVATFTRGEAADGWEDLIERIRFGAPVKCETPDCDWCEDAALRGEAKP